VRCQGGTFLASSRAGKQGLPAARLTKSYLNLPVARMTSKRPSVLLVDDDPILLRTTRRALAPSHHVVISLRPADALLVLSHERIDIIVTDHDVPGTPGGVWLLEQAKERFPEVGRILISGRTVPAEVRANEAVQRFVHKRAGLDQLRAHIRECLAS